MFKKLIVSASVIFVIYEIIKRNTVLNAYVKKAANKVLFEYPKIKCKYCKTQKAAEKL